MSGVMPCFKIAFTVLLTVYLNGGVKEDIYVNGESEFETHPYDGFYNNLLHPDWGAVDGQLLRKSPPAYSDGVYQPSGGARPNPFVISKAAHQGRAGLASLRGRTAFMVYFGQQVVEEIIDSQRPGCPREFFNIPVNHAVTPQLDPDNKEELAMPFFRSRYDQTTGYSPNNPRQQLNENTPYIDGTLFYGPGKAWADAIRELSETKKGRLKAIDPNVPINESFPALNDIRLPFANPPPPREHELKPVARFWRIGNPRGNENPFLLSFGVLFFRYHNYLADKYAEEYSGLNDEQVFNLARKMVIATHQKIVMYDWLPAWLEIQEDRTQRFPIPPYDQKNQYDPNIHPGITHEFQTAALRFGHTLVTPGTWIRNKNCEFQPLNVNIPGQPDRAHALRLCNAYWNPQEFLTSSPDAFDNMLLGLSTTLSEREDHVVVPDLREHLFGPLEFSRRDLVAINIQRGRDHGLPDYNSVRETFGLSRKASWEDINTYTLANAGYPNDCYMCESIDATKAAYGGGSAPDDLDLFTGGILETTPDGPGELFKAIMLEQFMRIRNGDRFWYENAKNGLFNDTELEEINSTTIRDIILMVTGIESADIGADPFVFDSNTDTCAQPYQLQADSSATFKNTNEIILENCTTVQYYDYFSGSEYSFALSFALLGLCVPGTIAIMVLMVKLRQRRMAAARRAQAHRKKETDPNTHHVIEIVGPNEDDRNVKVTFDDNRKKIHVTDTGRKLLRLIDLRHVDKIHVRLSTDRQETLMSIRVPGDIDLVLRFSESGKRREFMAATDTFLQKISVRRDKHEMAESMILKDATTKEQRKKVLDKFIRVVCIQAFKTSINDMDMSKLDAETANSVSKVQLTKTEFADALGLKPTSTFVRNMFRLADKDRNGLVNFHEFMNTFMVLSKGNADDKAHMLFNMYDIRRRGELTAANFAKMIQSMLDLSDSKLDTADLQELVGMLYMQAGLKDGQNMTFKQFKKIFASEEYEKTLANATLQLPGAKPQWQERASIDANIGEKRKTFIDTFEDDFRASGVFDNARTVSPPRRRPTVKLRTLEQATPKTGLPQKYLVFTKYFENYRRQIFWVTLFVLVTIGIFLERALYYSFEREHVGLRRLAGYGVTVTRGAASGMMWTYSCLLLTMSRNVITFLRETFLHAYIPFDSAHEFHKFIAALALFFTVMHVVGHGINLYHISTWASGDLNCVFREYFRPTDVLASFHYWAWTTITGLTGIILTVIVIVMYVFAIPYARRNLFKAFWVTHGMYMLLYLFLVLHGSGRLVQAPLTQNYMYGPLAVFIFDKLISISRMKVELSVKKAELLPSDVLGLTFKRPLNFEYKSGQWVRIACLELGSSEFHPFTLTSAPHEEHLSLHIRAVGPWTMNMRKTYDLNNRNGKPFPKVRIEGPFGEGHQDWNKYEVSVLVGGGIGVTPFASILKDIVNRSRSHGADFACQKVYFLWITRTQKQFEWLTDIIREVEDSDENDLVDVHIFITQFQQKFDLRTTMLYICERNFQKICGKSLFTGLRATTHFGRPQLEDFFNSLHIEHPKVKQVGVFSCGPPPMTLSVDKACAAMNKYEKFPTYSHHYENF